MINYKFINADNKKNDEIKIDDIYLSPKNPRYTLVNINKDNIKNFEEIDNPEQNDENACLSLLKNEGVFDDFANLLNSFIESGFQNKINDHIILVKAKIKGQKESGKYVVIEGNRRILALKLIKELVKLPSLDNFGYNSNLESKSILNNDENAETEQSKTKQESNYKKVKSWLEFLHNDKNVINWEIYYNVVENYDELIAAIYSKHLTGEKIGMRRWPRSKYYADLLVAFPDGVNLAKDETKEIIKKFQRSEEMIISDYKQAQFVYKCFYYGKSTSKLDEELYDDEEYIESKYKEQLLECMASDPNNGVSALEYNHSLSKIRKIIIDEYDVKNDDEFKVKYFDINYRKENYYILEILKRQISESKMFSFIYNQWKNGVLTTRAIKEKDLEKLKIEIGLYLISDFNFNNSFLNSEEAEKIDEWKITEPEILKKFIGSNFSSGCANENVIKRWKKRLSILENDYILENTNEIDDVYSEINWEDDEPNKLKNLQPIYIFNVLKKQYKSINKIYINALAATVRTLWEQVILWCSLCFQKQESMSNKIVYKNLANELYTKMFTWDKQTIDIITSERTGKLINVLQNHYKRNPDDLKNVLLSCAKDIHNNDYEKIVNNFVILFTSANINVDNVKKLNEIIHAQHRLYNENEYLDILDTFEKMQKALFDLLTIIDFKKFETINEDIKNKANQKINKFEKTPR